MPVRLLLGISLSFLASRLAFLDFVERFCNGGRGRRGLLSHFERYRLRVECRGLRTIN